MLGWDDSYNYRNAHCAICNAVRDYRTWQLMIFSFITAPDEFDFDLKMEFELNNGGFVWEFSPPQARHCLGSHLVSDCNNTDHISYSDCLNGSILVVATEESANTKELVYFKNSACAECNGYPGVTAWKEEPPCYKQGFGLHGLLFSYTKYYSSETEFTESALLYCQLISNHILKYGFCMDTRRNMAGPSGGLANEYRVFLSFKETRTKGSGYISTTTRENYFKSALIDKMSLLANQVSEISMHTQGNDYYVAAFRLTITPYQGLIAANQDKLRYFSGENRFLRLLIPLNITENFMVSWDDFEYTVIKVVSRQLSCFDGKRFNTTDWVSQNLSQKLESADTMLLRSEDDKKLTLCPKLLISDCNEGSYVPLAHHEYGIDDNLVVFHHTSMLMYKFGEYLITRKSTGPATNDSIIPMDAIISLCMPNPTVNANPTSEPTSPGPSSIPNPDSGNSSSTIDCFQAIMLGSLAISIICLLLFLITFGLFKELRTLRGRNLVNLALSSFLSHSSRFIASVYKEDQTCIVLALLGHYLFLVSFVAMTIISYHNYHVIFLLLTGDIPTNSRWTFLKYSAFVWLTPGTFVVICRVLDDTETFTLDYGTKCWLGNTNAMLYFLLLPLAILLVYNIYTFIRVSVVLSLNDKQNNTIQGQEGRKNLLFSAKLVAFVCFPWLFTFLGILYPGEEAFDYLFAIFICLQGVYIALSYFSNQKTFKLYKNRWNVGKRDNEVNDSFHSAGSFGMSFL